MSEIDNELTPKQLYRTCVLVIVITTTFIAGNYFYVGIDDGHWGESIVTLEVKASDGPEYFHSKLKIRYRLKAQEFNCRFRIEGIGLDILKDDEDLRKRGEAIRRGDNLQLTILASEQKNFSSLYYEGLLLGLAIDDKVIYSTKDKICSDTAFVIP